MFWPLTNDSDEIFKLQGGGQESRSNSRRWKELFWCIGLQANLCWCLLPLPGNDSVSFKRFCVNYSGGLVEHVGLEVKSVQPLLMRGEYWEEPNVLLVTFWDRRCSCKFTFCMSTTWRRQRGGNREITVIVKQQLLFAFFVQMLLSFFEV